MVSFEGLSSSVWDAKHLRLATDAAGVALWSWNVDTDCITMDERAFSMWGVPRDELVTFEDLSSHIHPQDLDRVKSTFVATRAVVGALRDRLSHHGRRRDPVDIRSWSRR